MTHAFVPKHLQAFAKYLFLHDFSNENYDLQCIYRSIVNRAYLSTYLHTSDWIIDNGPYNDVKDYSKGDIGYHAAILIALKFFKRYDVHKRYSEFIDLRVIADYNIVDVVSRDDAKRAIELADEICNALQ
ncbi:hypothetical protein [Methanobrevibacter sp.]|uniref:hypothetical protein n=1 Tax=Methanobrevibacter sp. TaxID=66852 RepID=UPI0025CBF290|nr:hypothetical protein [Methanobrevibacter sp.]MBQ6099989.1 hypothetical protein [Methanobrevibacter sp.]MBQ6512715.1 hypothetical protein [Methanobrevibacter sp.]